ncbi:MAG: hypothetical protein AB2385_11405 [Symbiobacterium sp.]|uniref:hypothetical protein n=1 Tax=Symbiobacterium sp. TaxID=1971213 RepID=UPI00346468D9
MRNLALWLTRVALLGGTAALLLGGLLAAFGSAEREPGAGGATCASLQGLAAVAVTMRGPDGAEQRATGYGTANPADVLLPVQGLVEPYLAGRGVYWDGARRTASLLGERDVLSVHFPAGRDAVDKAVLNGTVVPARSVLCGGRLYLPAGLLAPMLNLEVEWSEPGGARTSAW